MSTPANRIPPERGFLDRVEDGIRRLFGRTDEPAGVPVFAAEEPVVVRQINPRTLGAGHVRYSSDGRGVYDSPRADPGGHRPSHLIDMLVDPIANGLSIDDYERIVLARPSSSFGPEVRQVDRSVDSLEPPVRDAFLRMAADAAQDGVSIQPGETRRSRERQKYLFQQGRSRPGSIVTYTLTSRHENGDAIDVAPEGRNLDWLNRNAARYGFSMLGAWDPGHIQYTGEAHAASAAIHAREAMMGQQVGNFGGQSSQPVRDHRRPRSAEEVAGPTNAVRRAGETARRNRKQGARR